MKLLLNSIIPYPAKTLGDEISFVFINIFQVGELPGIISWILTNRFQVYGAEARLPG